MAVWLAHESPGTKRTLADVVRGAFGLGPHRVVSWLDSDRVSVVGTRLRADRFSARRLGTRTGRLWRVVHVDAQLHGTARHDHGGRQGKAFRHGHRCFAMAGRRHPDDSGVDCTRRHGNTDDNCAGRCFPGPEMAAGTTAADDGFLPPLYIGRAGQ